MGRRGMSTEAKALWAVGAVAGSVLLYYLLSGAGSEKDAVLIPNSIEKRLDKVIDALNREFGKDWVRFGISALEAGLSKVLPPPLVGLVMAVHKAEQTGIQLGVSGAQKKQHAIQFANALGRA